jgi:hypothetical protein
MRRSVVFGLGVVLGLACGPRAARAQTVVTDEERQAARNLYFEGVRLQEEGKYADALDRFSRAQRIFSAPTHVLRMAECQRALGKLVESAESYRAIIRADLGRNAPPAFVQAQQQAAAELPAVEAIIPTLKVDVLPQNVQNPYLTINGQPVNAALIGVARPINPGTHTVAATAPGYAKAEQTVTIAEKDKKAITLELKPGGVVYGTPPVIPVYTVPANPPPQTGVPVQQPDRPPEYRPDERKPKAASSGLLVGIRLGADLPAGDLATPSGVGSSALKISERASTGFGFGIEGGFRVATKLVLGADWQFAGYGQSADYRRSFSSNQTVTSSQYSNYLGGIVGFVSNPDGTAFYGSLGVGYRWFTQKTEVLTAGTRTTERADTLGGVEFGVTMGVWFKAAPWLRLVPKASAHVGSFSENNCTGTGCGVQAGFITPGTIASSDRSTHVFIFVGLAGYFNMDFGQK